jgi:outer membrane protein assembly factor BamB
VELGTNKLAVDATGNTLVALEYRGTVDLGAGPMTATGFRDGLIARYDAAGNLLWGRSFGGPSAFVTVKAAGIDGAGNLIVAGTYTGDIDFGGGAGLTYQAFTTNMFLVKFDTNGDHLWSRRLTGGLVEITGVTGDAAGYTVVAGYHGSAFDFGGGPLDADLYDVFVARYDPTGTHVWSRSFGDPGTYQYAFDVATDAAGNVFITGHFNSAVDFGGGDLISAGSWDIFVARFDQAGTHQWSRRFGDAGTQRAYSLAVDGSDAVTVAGHFFGTVDFGGGALTADPLDFVVFRLDEYGNHVWSRKLDLYNLGMKNDKPYAIAAAVDTQGDAAFTGAFTQSIDCGGGDLAASDGWDSFVVRYGAVATGVAATTPSSLELRAFPNPFNPQTTIAFTLDRDTRIRLTVHDVRGRVVRTLAAGVMTAGEHALSWNGRDDAGRAVASGVYFARCQRGAGSTAVDSRRLVLLK